MIYTSYYAANLKSMEENNIVPIGISLIIPSWYKGLVYEKISPTPYILSLAKCENPDYRKYIDEYSKLLMKLDHNDVINELYNLSKGKDIALLCYETPKKFCHRHIFSDWIKYHTNIKIEEYMPTNKNNFGVKMLF